MRPSLGMLLLLLFFFGGGSLTLAFPVASGRLFFHTEEPTEKQVTISKIVGWLALVGGFMFGIFVRNNRY
jgi:hypothetical protein